VSSYTGQVQVDFTHDPTSASFTWVDITNRARSASYRRGRNYERAQVEAGGGTLKLRNDDGALDPSNGASPYSPNVLPFKRIQHNITVTGPGTVPIFTGLVERWPQEWDAGYGAAPVQVVDIFAWLSLATLKSCYEQEVLLDAPDVFYPLTEASGSTSAGDISGKGRPTLYIVTTNDRGDASFGTATGIATDATSTLTLNSTLTSAAADVTVGDSLQPTAGWSWSGTSTVTVEAVISVGSSVAGLSGVTGGAVPVAAVEVITAGGDWAAQDGLSIVLYLDGAGHVQIWNSVTNTGVGPVLNDGGVHHLAVVNNATANTLTYFVDGVQVSSSAGAASFGGSLGFRLAVGGWDVNKIRFRGGIGYIAAYPSALSATRIAAHSTAAKTAFAGETADARIARLLSYAGWTATTALDATTTAMNGATNLTGKSALAAIQDVATSEGGVFFVSKAGTVTYKSRRTRMATTTSSATFGENIAGGEVPYVAIGFDFDPTYVYNDVQITRTGAGAATSATSSTSKAHYGQRTLAFTFDTQSDSETQDAANWLLNGYLAPHLRVRSVTVDCLSTPGAWAAVLPLEIGSRVTVKRRPANGTTVTVNSFVESIAWDIVDGRRARCTFELSPIPLQALIANDATYGICDSTFVAAW
jgi:hypothetical protein